MPKDIPLAPTEELYPATIYGDGNCLPRSACMLAHGSEHHHKEIRERIVDELVKNEELYLDNKTIMKGMNEMGHTDVTKTFALYSSMYTGTQSIM